MMDTYSQPVAEAATQAKSAPKRQRWTIAEKRRIVEETLVEGTSVARVARAHAVNANQVFYWRTLYQRGRLGPGSAAKLLPVRVTGESSRPIPAPLPEPSPAASFSPGTIHIELRHAQVHIEGNIDPVSLRVLLECLRR
jgi:transposase